MLKVNPGLLQPLFDAVSLGSIYALGALGIALIFGVMRRLKDEGCR